MTPRSTSPLSAASACPPHPAPATADPARAAAAVRVLRACGELRHGRPLALASGAGHFLAAAVETLDEALLHLMQQAGAPLHLVLSAERLQALAAPAGPRVQAWLQPPGVGLQPLQRLAAVCAGAADADLLRQPQPLQAAEPAALAALSLCKRVRLLPALVMVQVAGPALASLAATQVLQFDPADVELALPGQAPRLRRVSDAHVPLAAEEDCTLVLFRDMDADLEHVAIIVGKPAADLPVPVRLHSACLTGDLLGSLRCDCGPQLQRAVAQLAETGGVLLYLAQEGRGLGLANKLRAYRLQDAGLDTLQADRHLGFREDERDFAAAAVMLKALGHPRIQLLTNNPQKIEALRCHGIEVADRLPLPAPVNSHNERYMRTKQQAGHLGDID